MYQSISKSSLRFHHTNDFESTKVDLQPFIYIFGYLLLGAPGSSMRLLANPKTKEHV